MHKILSNHWNKDQSGHFSGCRAKFHKMSLHIFTNIFTKQHTFIFDNVKK